MSVEAEELAVMVLGLWALGVGSGRGTLALLASLRQFVMQLALTGPWA
ncbi:MAG: hypothetical protein HC922_02720 [Leptolyngbyaceae cyanobacterium SM2_3_12]|nr:hypothetical protein [Leptolyngbyaceae cyanobacterium SM2_3_12]